MNKKGFTLVEILVVATILGVMAAGAMTAFTSINVKSRDSKRVSDLEQVRSALEMYRADNSLYVNTSGNFTSVLTTPLKGSNYIDKIPTDPKFNSTSPYTYNTSGGATYYLCARLEDASNGTSSCSSCSSPYNYCVKNP